MKCQHKTLPLCIVKHQANQHNGQMSTHEKKFIRQNKNILEHTKNLANIIGQATTQVAALFVKGAQPKIKLRAEAALRQVQRPRSSSASSQRSAKSDGYDTDVEMKEMSSNTKSISKNYRMDNQNRGRAGT
jgi:hypothetical protein